MNIFLLGGWVARPSAFYFCGIPVFALSYSVWLGRYALSGRLACSLCFTCSNWSPVYCGLFNRVQSNRTLSNVGLPVLGMPSISALLGYYSPFIHLILHTYSLDNI